MLFYKIAVIIVKSLLKIFCFFSVKGVENIPKDGAFILCSNHKSNIDPVLIACACPRQLTFMAKEELFKVPVLKSIIKSLGAFPIKRGKGDAGAVMAAIRILHNGGCTLIFPEGRRVKKGETVEINDGLIKLAQKTKVCIVPAYTSRRTVTFYTPVIFDEYSDIGNSKKLLMDTIYKTKSR